MDQCNLNLLVQKMILCQHQTKVSDVKDIDKTFLVSFFSYFSERDAQLMSRQCCSGTKSYKNLNIKETLKS